MPLSVLGALNNTRFCPSTTPKVALIAVPKLSRVTC